MAEREEENSRRHVVMSCQTEKNVCWAGWRVSTPTNTSHQLVLFLSPCLRASSPSIACLPTFHSCPYLCFSLPKIVDAFLPSLASVLTRGNHATRFNILSLHVDVAVIMDTHEMKDDRQCLASDPAGTSTATPAQLSIQSDEGHDIKLQVDERITESTSIRNWETSTMLRASAKHQNLRLEIPERVSEYSDSSPMTKSFTPTPNKDYRSHSKGRIIRSSPKVRSPYVEMQQKESLKTNSKRAQHENKMSPSKSFSWTHVLVPLSAKRTASMPVTPVADFTAPATSGGSLRRVSSTDRPSSTRPTVKGSISRSLSVPVPRVGSLTLMGSVGGRTMLVRPATPRVPAAVASKETISGEEEGEEIPEEEAVCRICMEVLNEGGDTFRMDCMCKGELALAHKDCAMKWFGIKGNRTCDVCGQEVENLPVTLIRLPTDTNIAWQQLQVVQPGGMQRVWQDVPVLMMISMLGYFCFLEQLLVNEMGSGALAIALPFACVLGFVASISASTVVSKKYIWIFAAFQFGLVILFSHLFYSVVHMKPAVVAVLLASFAGFGFTMSIAAFGMQYEKWRRAAADHAHARNLQHESQLLDGQHHPEPLPHEAAFHELHDIGTGLSQGSPALNDPLLHIVQPRSLQQ